MRRKKFRKMTRKLSFKKCYSVERADGSISYYDEVKHTSTSFYLVCKNRKWGVINAYGQVTVPLEYDYIIAYNRFIVVIGEGNKHGIFSYRGKEIFPMKYFGIDSEDLILFDRGENLCGAIRVKLGHKMYNSGRHEALNAIADFPSGKCLHKNDHAPVDYDRYKRGFVVSPSKHVGWCFIDFSGKVIVYDAYDMVTMSNEYNIIKFRQNPKKAHIVTCTAQTVYKVDCDKIRRIRGYENTFLARTDNYTYCYELIIIRDNIPMVWKFDNYRDYFHECRNSDTIDLAIDSVTHDRFCRILRDYGVQSI
ncbi:hypothetical protein IKG54_00815 [Candidatus Saccharibacteria bacterium]|nr:hypothetical protein [Candidatus Saccharibacteria bacterium]